MSAPNTETFYVTKYALTDGIWEVGPGDSHFFEGNLDYLYVGHPSQLPTQVKKIDYHRTLEDAEQRVEQLKEAKLRSLEKATTKIKHYKAEVKPWKR